MGGSRGLALLVLAALLAASRGAAGAGGDPASRGASGATMSSLPTGTLAQPPRGKVPTAIGAGEHAPGVFVASPPVRKGQGRADFVAVMGSAAAAKDFAQGTGRGEAPAAGDVCFTEQPRFFAHFEQEETAEPTPWSSDLRPMLTMSNGASPGERRPPVTAVHAERLVVVDAKHATLEATDAWVDPVTRGSRLIAKSSVPLVVVASFLGGAVAYGARDGDRIHVVVARPMTTDNSRRGSFFGVFDDSATSSSCDHFRATLRAEKGQGHTASVVLSAELDPPAKEQPRDPFGRTEARTRPLHISPSVTWASRDKEALLTVSAGWDAREKNGFGF